MGKHTGRISVGIDIGSTTTKMVAVDACTHERLFSCYGRHYAQQAQSVLALIDQLEQEFSEARFRAALCGSGGLSVAGVLGLPYTQEVIAGATAVHEHHPATKVAIELGGQDAKIVFFSPADDGQPDSRDDGRGSGQDEDQVASQNGPDGNRNESQTARHNNPAASPLLVSNMRMNGVCAGGTGAFIDEVALLLNIPIESFDSFAARGRQVFEVSGRCGVFAKTDIQPLLNRGVPKEDIALSALHAIAKQTICGLAQGLDIAAPVALMGGPAAAVPTLAAVFAERLGLDERDITVPNQPETVIALGAALSLDTLFADAPAALDPKEARRRLLGHLATQARTPREGAAFFADDEERARFLKRHGATPTSPSRPASPSRQRSGPVKEAYLGIDSGSTTTKFVLIDTEGKPFEFFYTANEGQALERTVEALRRIRDAYKDADTRLDILGVGTTGYGEDLFARAFNADYHVVETVAHAHAAQAYVPDLSFLLDIGGQDMKALWVNQGVITDIVVNEACSSGCGSFLESFASSLAIPVQGIARHAFDARSPAELGSRCTVFMNSSIVTELRNGKTHQDIMAGLCRSVVENVFTKVIRASNLESLGDRIVVQGGTFKNDAVLCAFERYVGKEVVRPPHPEAMGAIGVALLTKEHMQDGRKGRAGAPGAAGAGGPGAAGAAGTPGAASRRASRFAGLEALDGFSYTQETGLVCQLCPNRCLRSRMAFSNGLTWVTGARCSRGRDPGDRGSPGGPGAGGGAGSGDHGSDPGGGDRSPAPNDAPDLFKERETLLFMDYPFQQVAPLREVAIGLPRVLSFWETMPFWKAFFSSLGFRVVLSRPSSQAQYESGLPAVTSDTACLPAKLVHGHIRDLVEQGVDRIFLPAVTTGEPEGPQKSEESMCALVKGTPFVIKNADDPHERWGVPFDAPLFHWFSKKDRNRQLVAFMRDTFDIPPAQTRKALRQGDAVQASFKQGLLARGAAVIEDAERKGQYALVLAGRPYHGDALVSQGVSGIFAELGVPVLPVDCVPGLDGQDLSKSRLDVPNAYLARILSASLVAARSPHLELAQLVSFGCGHDAYLADEVARLMREAGGKSPLVLKVDEGGTREPLRIRVRSFVETVALRRRREQEGQAGQERQKGAARGEGARDARGEGDLHALPDPYPAKFTRPARRKKTVLLPNTAHAFSQLMAAAFTKQGLRAVSLGYGRAEAVRLGKKYVHNDMCFPVQVVVGEVLEALSSGEYPPDDTAVAIAKYADCCRLAHYCALLRKALDDAGFPQVPIVTNDDVDSHALHPGFTMSWLSLARITTTLPMADALEELLHKIRPYELVDGSADAAYETGFDLVLRGLATKGMRGARAGFKKAINIMGGVAYDRTAPRQRIRVMGEFLMSFHPGANKDIESYLESSGFEVALVRMTDMVHKIYFSRRAQAQAFGVRRPLSERLWYSVVDAVFEMGNATADHIAARHPLHEPITRLAELVQASDPLIHHSFDTGEGVLTPAEILHHAARGDKAFIVLQPFGCLPNHVVGRGLTKRIKELYPTIQVLALDFDPDTSFANIENRLQMMIANIKADMRKQGDRT
ncbi:MAG: acyl-CoA dehydratase activase [Eggerthellaceae bacterium]|nr:acyl-CoA dehydratase activase [Eggerthellaceae bacterium]